MNPAKAAPSAPVKRADDQQDTGHADEHHHLQHKRRKHKNEIRYRRIRAGFIRISASVMKAADA